MNDSEDDDMEEWLPPPPSNKRRKRLTKEEILRSRVRDSRMPRDWKEEAYSKLDSSDCDKGCEYVEALLKIPVGCYEKLPVTMKSTDVQIKKYFQRVEATLDAAVFGMKTVKDEVMNYIAQIISTNNRTKPRVLGLCGSPGIGKTAIIRKGFALALNRPLVSLSMGGVRDSNYFLGHDYTYVGSKPGILVQNLVQLGCMNGIMFMDEVDKISNTHDGNDIQNLLLHITDPVQNNTFHDKYFAGLDIDLSNIIFVFSYNDESLIDPILRDRIFTIKVPDPSFEDKVEIGMRYLLKELTDNIGLRTDDVVINSEVMGYILKHYCKRQKGVRQLKKCLETLLLKINTARFAGFARYKTFREGMKLPLKLTTEMVDELLADMREPLDKYVLSMYI